MTGIDRDVLITRVLDGEATPEDWAAFRAMAERDTAVWGELADAQQDRAELATALAEAIAVADHVEAPIDLHAGERVNTRFRTGLAWVGWAAAAVMAIGVLGGRFELPSGGESLQAGLFGVNTPEDALRLYMDKGQEAGSVLGEMPDRVLLQTIPVENGVGYEVIYIRQLVERTRVDNLFQFGQTESGQRVPVPYDPKPAWRFTY